MRVVHVYKDVYPPVAGGIERQIDSLRLALPEIEQDVLVCSRGPRTTRRRCESPRHGEELLVGEFGRILSVPISPSFPWQVARYGAGAVVHVHMPNPIGELGALLAGRRKGLIATYHADIVRQQHFLRGYEPVLRRCLQECDQVLVATERMASESSILKRSGVTPKVVPYATDLDTWASPDPAAVAALREQHGRHVLATGRLVYYKGFDRLIDIADEIDWGIVIVGEGPERPALEARIAAKGVGDRVHLAGGVSDARLAAHLAAAELFVLPSVNRAEAFGIALLEAQAAGLAVIATDTGSGTIEALAPGESGVVVPPDDRAALKAAINRLIRDPDARERMGQEGRRRMASRHSLDALAARMRPIYSAVWRGEPNGERPRPAAPLPAEDAAPAAPGRA